MSTPQRLEARIPEKGFAHPDDMLDAFLGWAADSGLQLYPHEEKAILELFAGNHVILDTPTGSGRSLVATALHFKTLAGLGRAWYTAPIKALVSERFVQRCALFGAEHVGDRPAPRAGRRARCGPGATGLWRPMSRTFNTTGPCNLAWHYMLPAEARLPDLVPFVEQRLYFVLHAARQTGKTTAIRAIAARLRERGVAGVTASLEMSQGFDDPADAEPQWLKELGEAAKRQLPPEHQPPPVAPHIDGVVGQRLRSYLRAWSEHIAPTPLVVLLDEADVLQGPSLISLLRQLRAGFPDRPDSAPASVALVGMRDLRDYLTRAKDGASVNQGPPSTSRPRRSPCGTSTATRWPRSTSSTPTTPASPSPKTPSNARFTGRRASPSSSTPWRASP